MTVSSHWATEVAILKYIDKWKINGKKANVELLQVKYMACSDKNAFVHWQEVCLKAELDHMQT